MHICMQMELETPMKREETRAGREETNEGGKVIHKPSDAKTMLPL